MTLPNPHLGNRQLLIGNICIQWSSLEYMLAAGIWTLVDVDEEVGKILTGNLDAKQRATMAHALAWQTNAPHDYKKVVKEVLTEMRDELIHRRNEAVHGIHFDSGETSIAEIELHRGKGGRAPRELSNDSLAELGSRIRAAAHKMSAANIALIQHQAAEKGCGAEVGALIEDILRNISETSAAGERNGPE